MNFSILPSFNFFKRTKVTPTKVKETSQLVEPLRNDFTSTKDMFTYAKKRCVDAINSDKPYEHTVLVDTKQNKVLAEFVGDANHCNLNGIERMQLDKDNTILLHGHPVGTPISSADVSTILNTPVTQVIAFDKEDTFYDVTRDIVHSTKIIELHENGGELFGWSWAKKAAREKQIATETGVIEES